MKVGDTVLWVTEYTTKRVRLTQDLGDRWVYRTVGGAVGWESDDVKEHFRPLTGRKPKG